MNMYIYIHDFLYHACDAVGLHGDMVCICLHIYPCDHSFECLYIHISYTYAYIYMYVYTPIHEYI